MALTDDGLVFHRDRSVAPMASNQPSRTNSLPGSSLKKNLDRCNLSLSTDRLKPLKQTTKHGSIEILRDGRVVLEFKGDEHIIVVSPDGSKVCGGHGLSFPMRVVSLLRFTFIN